jgi:hypothetical protein
LAPLRPSPGFFVFVTEISIERARLKGSGIERATLYVLSNTAATGALGALFWLLAPRFFDDDAVAASVAASSVLIVLSFIAQVNMATALSKFLPGAGTGQRALLTYAYRLSISLSCGLAIGVIIIGLVRGGSVIEGGDLSLTLALAISVPLWAVFALQDGALVAMRQSKWLPIENGLTAALKLLLLPAIAPFAAVSGILLAWVVPIVPAILIVNHYLYRHLLNPGSTAVPDHGVVVRYALGDLAGLVLMLVSLRLVPVYVVETEGSKVGAYIGVSWSILAVSALALPSISRLALSEMSHHPEEASHVLHRLTRFVLKIFVPGAIVGALLASTVLRIAGRRYADGGSAVLAWGLIGLIPAALVECELAALRFRGSMARITALQAFRAVILLVSVIAITSAGHADLIGLAFAMVNLVTWVAALLVVQPRVVSSR